MKIKIYILFLFTLTFFQSCKSQQLESKTLLPKIDNYTKGELVIMIDLNGNPFEVGKVTPDGVIHFNWSEIEMNKIENQDDFMRPINKAVGMTFCNDKQIEVNNEEAKAVDSKYLFLYKYGQQVGSLYPATQKEIESNSGSNRSTSLVLGSTISWVYSNADAAFKATCSVNIKSESNYDFKEVTNYDISLKKGWNIMQRSLIEKEDWKNNTEQGSLPKKMQVNLVENIPNTINWYMKYTANDEELEKRHQMSLLAPITNEQFEKWLPKKAGDFSRTSYEIGAELERSASKNNVRIIFENGNQKMEIGVIDGAKSPDDLEMVNLAFEMSEVKEDEGIRYVSRYNEEKKETQILSVYKDRIVLKAKGDNMTPEELWERIKTLNIASIVN